VDGSTLSDSLLQALCAGGEKVNILSRGGRHLGRDDVLLADIRPSLSGAAIMSSYK
jgi:hypothetical protein